ncbi:MAG: site-specific integrase [Tannerella sp.]|jgi:site-specific recombinase XerD|nr:site-specific integrase [Tannerella sp.]
MDNIQLRYIFDRRKEASDTGKGLLQIEVRLTGTNRRKLISTGVHLYRNQFSNKNGFTCRNHANAPLITGQVTRMFRQMEAFALSEKCTSLDDIRNWNKNGAETCSVVEFMRDSLGKRNPSDATLEHHNILIRQIEQFGRIKTFADLTYENIADFDLFLRRTVNSQPTLYKRHSALKSYITDAINRGLCRNNPYLQFRVQKGKSRTPVYLDESELKKMLEYVPLNEKLQKVKDLFVFQCFTGMAYIDMQTFSIADVSMSEGVRVIRSSRTKTDESFVSLLLPEAGRIAEKYDYTLPKLSNQKYNDYLKLLGAGAGLDKSLTSHVARHTFATYLINRDIPIESVSKALGHSSIRQTQHYARLLGKKVIEDMKKLL